MIKITIKGPPGSGKTTVSEVIHQTLLEYQNQGGMAPAKVICLEEADPRYPRALDGAKATLTGKHDVLIKVKQR